MSVALGPYTLTAGQITTVIEPSPGPSFASVILYNLSALFVSLNGGTNWLAPWTANMFAASTVGHPIQAQATGTAGTTGSLLATFLLDGEIPPNAVYPLALPATVVTAAPPSGAMTAYGFNFASAAIQAIPNNVETTLVWGSTLWDPSAGKSGNSYIVPATLAGPWVLRVQTGWLDDAVVGATGIREAYLKKNGATYLAQGTYPGWSTLSNQYYAWPAVEWRGVLVAGDVLTATARQTSGGALNASGGQMTNMPNFLGTYLGT